MLTFIVLGAVLCQFGWTDAILTESQVKYIVAKASKNLGAIDLDDAYMTNEGFEFKPFSMLKTKLKANVHLKSSTLYGLNNIVVKKVVTPKPEEPERLLVTLVFPKVSLAGNYDFATMGNALNNTGFVVGNFSDITVVSPVDTEHDVVTLIDSISFDYGTHKLKFSDSHEKFTDLLLNLVQCVFHDGVRAILRDNIIPYCEDIVLTHVNDEIPAMRTKNIK